MGTSTEECAGARRSVLITSLLDVLEGNKAGCRKLMTGRPLRDRRAWLEDVLAGSELVFAVRRLATEPSRRGGR